MSKQRDADYVEKDRDRVEEAALAYEIEDAYGAEKGDAAAGDRQEETFTGIPGGRAPGDALWNNQVMIHGKVLGEFHYSHTVCGESFWQCLLEVRRLSGLMDRIPVMVSERLMDTEVSYEGQYFEIQGQLRSHDRLIGSRRELQLSVFAREIWLVDEKTGTENQIEQICLDGFICREPLYRSTPFGREITELMLAVNRPYGKTDYIPCVCWGRNARYASGFSVGIRLMLWGRIQSREYTKYLEGNRRRVRRVYEVSVGRMEIRDSEKTD